MSTITDTRDRELAELRRVVGVLRHRDLRRRMNRLVDLLVHEARWDAVEEIRASRELADARAEADEWRSRAEAAEAERQATAADLGDVRRQRDDALRRLTELRELARPGMAEELIEVAVRAERERPTDPPPLVVRQASRLVRAVRG